MSQQFRTELVNEFNKFYAQKGRSRTTAKGIQSIRIRINATTVLGPLANEFAAQSYTGDFEEVMAFFGKNKMWDKYKKWQAPRAEASSKRRKVITLDKIEYSGNEIAFTWARIGDPKGQRLEKPMVQWHKNEIRAFWEEKCKVVLKDLELAWEHGVSREEGFTLEGTSRSGQTSMYDESQRQRIKAQKRDAAGAAEVEKTVKGNIAGGRPGAPGARGTNVDKSIQKAAAVVEAQGLLKSEQMVSMMKGFLVDYFDYDHDVIKDYSMDQIFAEMTIQGSINPKEWEQNTGLSDATVGDMFVDIFSGNAFNKEFARLAAKWVDGYKKDPRRFANLWSDSKNPLEALDLIAKKKIIQGIIPSAKPNMKYKVNKQIIQQAESVLGKKRSAAGRVKGRKPAFTRKTVAGAALRKARKKKKAGPAGAVERTFESPIALRNLMNEALPQMVASKMTKPALQFRTGRFANSARIEQVLVGSRGGIGIDYTYMRAPYETFEPGGAQGSTQRDPRKIIGESIRELATSILGRQPHTIRRT